jgi:peptidoglycan/LPS O-acetylase OafA/YrhL
MAPAMTLWGYTFLGLFYASGVMLVLGGHAPRFAAVLRHPFLVRVGLISYGVYLLHESVNGALHSLLLRARPRFDTPAEMAVTTLAFGVTLAAAELSWRWFEKPFVDWSHRRFRYRRSAPPGEAAPTPPAADTSPLNSPSK